MHKVINGGEAKSFLQRARLPEPVHHGQAAVEQADVGELRLPFATTASSKAIGTPGPSRRSETDLQHDRRV